MADHGMNERLHDNIERMAARRAAAAAREPTSERIARRITRFTGSMAFVYLHLALYGLWVVANLGWIPGVPVFDPSFFILASEASVEAIFLSTFVLISQNRMQEAADKRADLDLHINLLAEHELTRVADLVMRIAERMGIDATDMLDLADVRRDVEPEPVLDAIEAQAERLE